MTAAEITLGAVVCALWAVFLILSAIGTVVTHKDAKKKAAELHMVAYATYQLSLRIDELNNSKTKKRYLRTVAHRSTSQQPQNSRKVTSTKSLQWAKRP